MRKTWMVMLLVLVGCGRGHYATSDHVTAESSGDDGATTQTGATETPTETASTTTDEATTEGASTDPAETEAIVEVEAADPAPQEDMAPPRPAITSNVTITVRTTSGPITAFVARRALSAQQDRVERCYRSVLGNDAVGSIRASLHVEASGATRCELETMVPEIDRALPCVDAALERTPFPASTDGRPTHIILEVSRSAPR